MDAQRQQELDALHARIASMGAETAKLNAQVLKLRAENQWVPFVVGAAFFATVLFVIELFFC